MALHIIGIAACGGLLVVLPSLRLRRTIRTRRVQSDPLAYNMAACQFAHDVEKRLAHLQGAQLLISHDEWGGTHYDIVPTSRLMPHNTLVQIFHTQHLPIDLQPTDPQSIAYHAYSSLRRGSFGRPQPQRNPYVTRKLPVLDMLTTDDSTNGGAA